MPEYFFKYMDVDSAKLVLANRTFRFSSPLKFNDPFDTQNDLYPDYDLKELPRILMDVMEKFILSDVPLPGAGGPFSEAISIIREKSRNNGYKKSNIEDNIPTVRIFIEGGRVFCFSNK